MRTKQFKIHGIPINEAPPPELHKSEHTGRDYLINTVGPMEEVDYDSSSWIH